MQVVQESLEFQFEQFFQEIQDIFMKNTNNAYDIIHKELKDKIGKENELNRCIIKSKDLTTKNVLDALDKLETITSANYFSKQSKQESQIAILQKSADKIPLHEEILQEFELCEKNNQKKIAQYLENQIVNTLQDTFQKQDTTLRQISTERYQKLQKTQKQQNQTLEKTIDFLNQIQKK